MKLKLKNLKAKELVDTGSTWDPQDPCLRIKIGSVEFTTERKVDAKVDAEFSENYEWEITEQDYNANIEVEVEVINFNNGALSKKNIHVGSAKLPIKSLIPKFNEAVDFTIDLTHVNKKANVKKGKVLMQGFIENIVAPAPAAAKQPAAPPAEKAPAVTKPATETTTPAPSDAKPTSESTVPKKPEVKPEAAPIADEKKEIKPIEKSESKDNKPITPKDTPAQTPAQVPAKAPAQTPTQTPQSAQSTQSTASVTSPMHPVVQSYKLTIDNIQARDLKDTGSMLDPQDPAVRIRVGAVEHTTQRQQDAKTNASFEEVFVFPVDGNELHAMEIEVEALNVSRSGSKTHIGIGKAVLKTLISLSDIGQSVSFVIDLVHRKKGKEEPKGQIIMRGKLEAVTTPAAAASTTAPVDPKVGTKSPLHSSAKQPAEPKPEVKVDTTSDAKAIDKKAPVTTAPTSTTDALADLPASTRLHITKIEARGLKNVELMYGDKNDPYVQLTYESPPGTAKFSYKTDVKDGAGSAAVWEYAPDDPKLYFDLSAAEIRSTSGVFKGVVTDENKILAHVQIGSGQSELVWQSGNTLEVTIPIVDSKNKAAGTVIVTAVKEAVPVATTPAAVQKSDSKPVADENKKETKSTAPTTATTTNTTAPAMPDFQTGTLLIKRIVCQGLPNVESLGGKNDPYVTVQLGAENRKTECIEEGGSDVSFDYLDFNFAIDKDTIEFEPLQVKVFDKNNYTSHVLIGEVSTSLLSLLSRDSRTEPIELPLQLIDNKNKPRGKVILFIQLQPAVVLAAGQKERAIDPVLKDGGTLHINRIRVFDLKNTHAMISSTVTNPIAKLSIEDFKHTTPALDISKTKGQMVFDHLDLQTQVSLTAIQSSLLNLEIYTPGTISNTLIGKGNVAIKSAAYTANNEVELLADLVDRGTTTGRAVIYVMMTKQEVKTAVPEKIQDGFTNGFVHIKAITAHNLKNTEYFGKQDPYITLQYGDWKGRTIALANAGKESHWSNLDLKCDVSATDLNANQELIITAFDDNDATSDVLIGTGTITLRSAAVIIGKETRLSVDLFDKKKKSVGNVILNVTVYEAVKTEELKVPNGFTEGMFFIKKIESHELVTGNFISAPAPSIQIRYAPEWSVRAPVGEGNNPVWEHLDFKSPTPLPVSVLTTQPLVVELYDGKTLAGVGTIDNLLLPTAKLNTEQAIDVKLIHPKSTKNVSAGRVTLYITVTIPEKEVPIVALVPERKPAFERGILLITQITATDLKNVELIGKSDPFIALSYGAWSVETKPLPDAGGEVIYNYLEFYTEVTAQQLIDEPLGVTVWDKNSVTNNALIGACKLNLKRMAYSMGKEIELVALLTDKNNKPAGKLVLRTEIREPGKELFSKALPTGFTNGIVHITKMQTFELKNTEWLGKQDPFIVIKLSNDIVDKTPVKNNAGSDVLFDLLDIKAEVTATELKTQPLIIEVYDYNVTGNKLIGSGTASMNDLYQINKEIEIPVTIKSKRGDNTGRVLLFARLEECEIRDEDVSNIPIAKDFLKGKAIIQKIAAFKLFNTEMFGFKQDPYVIVSMNEFTANTPVQSNAGDNCLWDLLDINVPVDKPALESTQQLLNIVVKNKNLLGDTIIGTGTVSLRRAASELNKVTELTVHLINPKNKKSAGKVILHTIIRNDEPEVEYKLAETFEFGVLKISKIKAFNMKNTELLGGKQDPFIVLKLGEDWSFKTHTKEEAGSTAEWDFLAIETDIYRETILDTHLEVTVFDENSTRAHALIGSGTVSLIRCGAQPDKECELEINLVDEKAKPSGKVILYAQIASPAPDTELPDTFEQGQLKIKRISAVGLKNSEMFGLSKGDPFMILKLNDFTATTKPLPNAGANPSWNNLDYSTDVTAKNIKVDELTIEAWDQNSVSAHKKLGFCQLGLRKTGSKIDQEVELSGLLKDSKGKSVGRVIVLAQLTPIVTYAKPDLGLPKDFMAGVIVISRIQARGLANKELLGGKQDPYIRVTLGEWSETTNTLNNAGSNASWTNLDIQTEVNTDILNNEKFMFEVWDENATRGDCSLGVGYASMRKLCNRINNSVDLTVDLSDSTGAKRGELTLTAILQTAAVQDLADGLPDSAVTVKNGLLTIKQISGFDLKGGDSGLSVLGGKPDPYIMLELAGWKTTSKTLNNAGRNPVWSEISDMECPVTLDILRYKRLNVTVMDKNMLKDARMCTGDMSLKRVGSQVGSDVTQIIRMKDARGKSAGKIEIICTVTPVEPIKPAAATDDAQQSVSLGATKGKMVLRQCVVSQLRNTATFTKQDVYMTLRIAKYNKKTAVVKGAGAGATFEIKESTDAMATAQLLGQGAQVKIIAKGTVSEQLVGETTLPLQMAILRPNEWTDLKSDLTFENNSAGKCSLSVMFVPDGSEFDVAGHFGDKDVEQIPVKQVEKSGMGAEQFAQMEKRLKAQLEKERQELHASMAAQHASLSKSFEKLASSLSTKKPQPNEGLVVHEIKELKLPNDVKQWRNAHVQAWIAFQMELPQYMDAFQKASVDGLVLIKHITADTLQNSLDISDSLHCSKLLEGIKILQAKQKKIDEAAEKERLKRIQQQAEEDERKRKLLADMQKKEKKVPKKKKTQVSAPKPVATNQFGNVREQGVVDRARIERDMRAYRHDKLDKQHAIDIKNNTWSFEYTGKPQPKMETLYDIDPFAKTLGSKSYQNVMATEVLNSQQFATSSDINQPPKAPHFTKVRPIPTNCSTEEVLTVVKGAMFDLSNWLVEVEKLDYQRQVLLDSDLLDLSEDRLQRLADHSVNYDDLEQDVDNILNNNTSDINNKRSSTSLMDVEGSEWSEPPPAYDNISVADQSKTGNNISNNNNKRTVTDSSIADAEGSEWSEAPPAYDNQSKAGNKISNNNNKKNNNNTSKDDIFSLENDDNIDNNSDNESISDAPPAYDEFDELIDFSPANNTTNTADFTKQNTKSQNTRQPPHPPTSKIAKITQLMASEAASRPEPMLDRMTLVFRALVDQRNNNAKWLGSNDKLTRIKLLGGMESLLRLRLDWSQFDTLWTKLDYKRSGDIDLFEFKAFFGDLSEFETREGAQVLSTTTGSKAIQALTKCVYELCDALRHAGFTVVEMFSGFDRNGSGEISMSEFCSMLRLVVGNSFDKRLIYQALNVLDSDGNKSISLSELLAFVYRIWKSQLDELAAKLATLDDRVTGDSELIAKIIQERKVLKDAVKKNFPRQWRDKLEREGGANGHGIPGPFQSLLRRMDINTVKNNAFDNTFNSNTNTCTYAGAQHAFNPMHNQSNNNVDNSNSNNNNNTSSSNLNLGSPNRAYRSSETTWPAGVTGTASRFGLSAKIPSSPQPSAAKSRRLHTASANVAGHNQIMRFKIKVPGGEAPTRSGTILSTPTVTNLNRGLRVQSQETEHILSQNDQTFGSMR